MKRKIFSKLLMVALVIAAVGSFVSCKDYDDDINNLQKQIDAKAAISELTALQSTLEGKISTATAAAQKAAEDAAAKADASLKAALETAIADAKKAGTDAGTKAGEAITAANKAQETADAAAQAAKDADKAAKDALADALKTIGETYQTKAEAAEAATKAAEALADVKAIAEAAYTKAAAEELQKEVDDLKTSLEGLQESLEADIDKKIDAKIQEVNNAVASVDAIWKAVTSVELFASETQATPGQTMELLFLTGKEVADKFGADVTPAGNVARSYGAADKGEIAPVTYEKDKEISFDNRIIVRVNPANATFTEDSVTLINSLGESLDEFIEVKKVEAYNQLITRADVATGLYVVTIARKAGVTDDQLAEATSGAKITAKEREAAAKAGRGVQKAGDAMFALGIKSGAGDRFAYSTFDLGVTYGDYDPQRTLNFEVKGDAEAQDWTHITLLHNRWNGEKIIGEDETKELPGVQKTGRWNGELVWQNLNDDDVKAADRYTVDTLTANKKANYKFDDARYGIKTYTELDADSRSFKVRLNNPYVQYYYVTLDDYAAVESAPSEFQSWTKYEYTGLYTITPATDVLKVTVDDAAAKGDIIGFRVFAVNYDGSLVDPDGRSFYVKVGEVSKVDTETITISAQWTPRVKGDVNDPTWAGASAQFAVAYSGSTYGDVLNDNAGSVANDDDFGAPAWVKPFAPTSAELTATLNAIVADVKKAKPEHNTGLAEITWPADADVNGVIKAADLSGFIALDADGEVIDYAEYFINAAAFDEYVNEALVAGHPSIDINDYKDVRDPNKVYYAFLKADKSRFNADAKLSDIKYIAVGFENSQNWVDKATRAIKTLTIIDPDHHNAPIYQTSIDVTKVMPTISNDFGWKYTLGPDATGNLDVYVSAATAATTYVNWATAAPTTPKASFGLKDFAIFKPTTTNDYTLTVSGKGADNKTVYIIGTKNAGADAQTDKLIELKKGTDAITTGTFKFDTKYTAKLEEGITGIGLSEEFVRGAYANTISGFSGITFKDPVAAQTYAWKPYTYSVGASAAATTLTVTKSSTEYWLNWTDVAVGTVHQFANGTAWAAAGDDATKPGTGDVTAANLTLENLVSATNDVNFVSKAADAILFTGDCDMDVFAIGGYFKANSTATNLTRAYRAKLISGNNTEFYNVEIAADGKLTFTKNTTGTAAVAPAVEHVATLKVWAVDYFGNGAKWNATKAAWEGDEDADPIMELPITIKVD